MYRIHGRLDLEALAGDGGAAGAAAAHRARVRRAAAAAAALLFLLEAGSRVVWPWDRLASDPSILVDERDRGERLLRAVEARGRTLRVLDVQAIACEG